MIHPVIKTKENLICSYFEELLPLFSTSLFSSIFEMYDLNEYTTHTVRVAVRRDGYPSQESFQEFLRGYSEADYFNARRHHTMRQRKDNSETARQRKKIN